MTAECTEAGLSVDGGQADSRPSSPADVPFTPSYSESGPATSSACSPSRRRISDVGEAPYRPCSSRPTRRTSAGPTRRQPSGFSRARPTINMAVRLTVCPPFSKIPGSPRPRLHQTKACTCGGPCAGTRSSTTIPRGRASLSSPPPGTPRDIINMLSDLTFPLTRSDARPAFGSFSSPGRDFPDGSGQGPCPASTGPRSGLATGLSRGFERERRRPSVSLRLAGRVAGTHSVQAIRPRSARVQIPPARRTARRRPGSKRAFSAFASDPPPVDRRGEWSPGTDAGPPVSRGVSAHAPWGGP